jgi:hypothetical protein
MPCRSIAELKSSLKGVQIHVIGSGASMDDYDSGYFLNKTCIVMNDMYKRVNAKFSVASHAM